MSASSCGRDVRKGFWVCCKICLPPAVLVLCRFLKAFKQNFKFQSSTFNTQLPVHPSPVPPYFVIRWFAFHKFNPHTPSYTHVHSFMFSVCVHGIVPQEISPARNRRDHSKNILLYNNFLCLVRSRP